MNLFQKNRNSALLVCMVFIATFLLSSLVGCEGGDPKFTNDRSGPISNISDQESETSDTKLHVNDATTPAPASGMTAPLDEATKQTYYQEYIKIAAEVSKETELDISVVPMNEFLEEDWRTPEQFRNVITEVANWRLICTDLVEDNE